MRSYPVGFLVLVSLVHCRERTAPSGPVPSVDAATPSALTSVDAATPSALTSEPDADQLDESVVVRTITPFALPRPPWGGTEESITEAKAIQPVYVFQFFPDCREPVAVARWSNAGKAGRSVWDVTAYRCAGDIPGRVLPLWESDGFMVYGGRRDLVIEVYGHKDGGPTPAQWRGYVDKVIATIPASTPKVIASAPTVPVDRKKAKALMAKMQKVVGASLAMECVREPDGGDEQRALGAEMDRVIPSNQGNFEQVLHDVLICRTCSRDSDRCSDALKSLEVADAWVEKFAK